MCFKTAIDEFKNIDYKKEREEGIRNFLRDGAAVKKLIDKYIESNGKSTTCEFCKKHYSLRTKLVHEKHCLVRLAMESEVNPEKMLTFCLRACDFDDIPLEKPSDFTEVLKLTKADIVPKECIEKAYDDYLYECYNNGTMLFLCPDGQWRPREHVENCTCMNCPIYTELSEKPFVDT